MPKLNPIMQCLSIIIALSSLSSFALADEQPKALSTADLIDKTTSPNATKPKPSFDAKEFADTGRQSPAPIEAGPFYIYPTLGVSLGYDDNITKANSNTVSSSGTLIAPSIVADLINNGDRYVFGYNGKFLRYFNSKENNTDSNELQFQAENTYSSRLSSVIFSNLLYAEDANGSTNTGTATPDRYRSFGLKGVVGYGAADATGRVEFDASVQNKRYLNNLEATAVNDQDSYAGAARFFYRVAPKTRALLEARVQNFRYVISPDIKNSTEYRLFTGADWAADDLFAASVKVGVLKKSYDLASKGSFSNFSYEIAGRFMPRTYSTFDFSALRTASESTLVGTDYLLEDIFSASWNHAWSSYTSTRANLSYTKSDYIGGSRKDDTLLTTLNVDYKLSRWLKTGAEIRFENRDSNQSFSTYNRAIYMLNVSGSL
jgi:hypothetical protein